MPKHYFDCVVCRLCSTWGAGTALFGWDWGQVYRKDIVDIWELPLLAAFLVIGTFLPRNIAPISVSVPLRWILAFSCIATFVVWFVEKAIMFNGSYDLGGIVLRVLDYGLAVYLLQPVSFVATDTTSDRTHRGG